ncbi:hypothetical protein C4580_01970 [Candidatus Woesearchaeota archaeon]|nr:MAG: hypothetical protein C4580_01970 [Candidatus Woesearchaeota archaeon]
MSFRRKFVGENMNLSEFLAQFGIAEVPKGELVGRSYFEFRDRALLSRRPFFIGKCLAHVRGPVLVPGVDLLQFIGKKAKYKVSVSPEGEWLFICGRDIFGKSVVGQSDAGIGDRVAVLNVRGECIGYGDVIAPLSEKKVVIRRLFDLGDLLRRERRTKRSNRTN